MQTLGQNLGDNINQLGSYIKEQRDSAKVSLRQLADLAGVSNPYLSQIERGLRKPSAEILQQIAKGLRISAETLYVKAGLMTHDSVGHTVAAAIYADMRLNERHKQILVDIYESFCAESSANSADS
ncbi:MAG: helix-turn-helix transcriptional regulator [Antricoccus sp.]